MATQQISTASELRNAVAAAGAGDEIIARGGTYEMSGRWNIDTGGSSGNRLVIRAAEGENPHIQFAAGLENPTNDSGIKVNEPYVTVSGFEITDSGFKGIFAGSNGHDVTFENLNVHHCNRWAIMNNGNDNVVFRNCDSHDNFDPQNKGQHADGINMTGPAENGLIEGCRAWNNGDDGFDLWVSENHTVRYCWSWNNGLGEQGNGNGFKLGASPSGAGGGHLVHHCVSYGNKVDNDSYSPGSGFWWNGEDDNGIEVYNCTAWDNGVNFAFDDIGHVLKNNISYQGGGVSIGNPVEEEANSWNLGISDPEFKSTNSDSDDFLRLSASSDAIAAGVDVGLDYEGDAPDLGAFEYDGQSERILVEGETLLEASAAETDPSSPFKSRHSGYNGSGYINLGSDSGSYVSWPVDVATGGDYALTIRYALGDSSDRTALLNYDETQSEITFSSASSWEEWSTMSAEIELSEGATEVMIETTGEDGGNIDQVTIEPLEESTEPKEPSGDTARHGYHLPDAGQEDWHIPLNENFESIDRNMPIIKEDSVKEQFEPFEQTLYIAQDTGVIYVGNGSEWVQLGSLS